MNLKTKILSIIIAILIISTLLWKYFKNNGKKINLTNYSQDPIAKKEMDARVLTFAPKQTLNLFNILTSGFYEGFDMETYTGLFPIYTDSASLFSAANRANNLAIAKEMITKYNTLVQEASRIHRVPRILIYGIMLAEHERSVSLTQAESYSRPGSKYIGLMQISATTATDSLSRNITYKKLSQAQIDLFTKKGLIKGKGDNAIVYVSSANLRKVDINIHSGVEYLSRHINSWGIFQPEKIAVSYNQGEGALRRDGLTRATPDAIYSFYKKQTTGQIIQVKGYLLKILGKHGACDILYNDLGIKD